MTDGQDEHGPGQSSGRGVEPPSKDSQADEPDESSGDIEIPLGVPITEQEFRRLKEEAQRRQTPGEEAESDDPNEPAGSDDE
jgi:hypothetical protein